VEEFLDEFLDEANEMVTALAAAIDDLAERPSDGTARNTAYRCVHVIRGGAGFLGLGRVERLGAAGERLLGPIAAENLEPTARRLDVARKLGLTLQGVLHSVREEGSEPAGDDGDLLAGIEAAVHL